jgi:hypothetical protein
MRKSENFSLLLSYEDHRQAGRIRLRLALGLAVFGLFLIAGVLVMENFRRGQGDSKGRSLAQVAPTAEVAPSESRDQAPIVNYLPKADENVAALSVSSASSPSQMSRPDSRAEGALQGSKSRVMPKKFENREAIRAEVEGFRKKMTWDDPSARARHLGNSNPLFKHKRAELDRRASERHQLEWTKRFFLAD